MMPVFVHGVMVTTSTPLEKKELNSACRRKICTSERFVSDGVYELTSTYIGTVQNFETYSTIVT
jgi:hypothetical protein